MNNQLAHVDAVQPRTLLYVGSYTHRSTVGITGFDATDPDGLLAKTSEVEGIEHSSFLSVNPAGDVLYAVSELAANDGGSLVAFGVSPDDGSLSELDRASSMGGAPCYISVDREARFLYVANYVSGSVAAYALERDGRFGNLLAAHQHTGSGPHWRQDGPHAHCIVAAPGGDHVYAVDLGTDSITRYAHDGANRTLTSQETIPVEPGSGPRHLAFHPKQPVAFLLCELDSTIVTFAADAVSGRLTRRHTQSILPGAFSGESIGAEIRIHPEGRFVFTSNRGHDSIAIFCFAGSDAPLELVGHVSSGGRTPRGFAIHPSGRTLVVANQDSDSIVPFAIDPDSGLLRQLDESYPVSEPVSFAFIELKL